MKVLVILLVMFSVGCEHKQRTSKYIITERGLLSYGSGYCFLGMLTNNDGDNILNEDSNPITCSGYVRLTKKEFNEY